MMELKVSFSPIYSQAVWSRSYITHTKVSHTALYNQELKWPEVYVQDSNLLVTYTFTVSDTKMTTMIMGIKIILDE